MNGEREVSERQLATIVGRIQPGDLEPGRPECAKAGGLNRQKAAEVFDVNSVNACACRFMTITCDVRLAWRKRIEAVVHVDGSARPQTIAREGQPAFL